MEEDQVIAEEEVAPQDLTSNVENESTQQDYVSEEKIETKQDRNWAEMRRKQQEVERKSEIQEELIRQLLQAQQQSNVKVPEKQEEDEFSSLDADSYLTYADSQRLIEKKASKIAEQKYLEMERKREQDRFMERLQMRFEDFNVVVTQENIKKFEQLEPELAQTIADLKDPYKIGIQTYKFIKSLNLSSDEPLEDRHVKEVKKKIEKNEKTIQSPQSFQARPMAQAFSMMDMSKEEKEKLYDEMMGFAARSGGSF